MFESLFSMSVYMPTAAVLPIGSCVYLDAGHQGSSLSDHRKTTGFSPFKLPTRSPLQNGGTTPLLKLS